MITSDRNFLFKSWRLSCLCIIVSVVFLYSIGCHSEPAPFTAKEPTATVSAVIDGDTILLADPQSGAKEVRLVGTQAPKLPLDRPDFEKWPLADEAFQEIKTLSVGRRFRLDFTGRHLDRHGRLLAHMFRDDGLWLQGAMVQAGLARVYTFADNRAYADALLELESAARAERRGIWGHPYYAVRTPTEVRYDIGSFQVVRGDVVETARVGRWVYLNFGPNWRTDFTISINVKNLELFEDAGIELLRLSGAPVRVRGWVESRNGPMITLDHPEPLEIITQ